MVGKRDRRARPSASASEEVGVRLLHEVFERQRRRHVRLGRLIRQKESEAKDLRTSNHGRITLDVARQRVGYHNLWSRWSESYDDVAVTAGRLLRAQPRSLTDVGMMFRALEWVLISDGAIVDRGAERQVHGFGRVLRRLAAG